MKKPVALLAFLLLASVPGAEGQALPKHTYVVGGCNASAKEAIEIFKAAKAAPQFDLYIVCNSTNWHYLAAKNDFKESDISLAITGRHTPMIWLGPKSLRDSKSLYEAITHELDHLRCNCNLGE